MRVLTAEEMQAVDRHAIDILGIPGLVLMENAALGVVDALLESYPKAEKVAVFCGPGNNGGDGFAVARLLVTRGLSVETLLVGSSEPRGDAAVQRQICENLGIPGHRLQEESEIEEAWPRWANSHVIVDALFGTGLGRPLEGLFAALVQSLNALPVPRVAVDIPSGLSGSYGDRMGPAVHADLTVTFAAPKIAHLLAPAAEDCGEVVVVDLGFPPDLLEEAPGSLNLSTREEIAALLPSRERRSHKGTYGHLLVVGGSVGMSGAAILALQGALRSGVGLATGAVPSEVEAIVSVGAAEAMTVPLPSESYGDWPSLLESWATGHDAIVVGPGLGSAVDWVESLVLALDRPVVIDADGLRPFQGRLNVLQGRKNPTILTPHPGEMARLLKIETEEVMENRFEVGRKAAAISGAVVVLKGHQTLVVTPAGEIWINPSGNPGLATGGTGDVLAGLLGSFLAQGRNALTAARLGVWLHGRAGDLAAEARGEASLIAGDVVDSLGAAFGELRP